MKSSVIIILAFLGGVFLAMQAVFNSRVGVSLKNPLNAVIVSSFFSLIFALTAALIQNNGLPDSAAVKSMPLHMWFLGGLLSTIGISFYFYAIPKIGISATIVLGLIGQLLFSVIAGHLGLLNLPKEPINMTRLIGVLCLIAGIILIKKQ